MGMISFYSFERYKPVIGTTKFSLKCSGRRIQEYCQEYIRVLEIDIWNLQFIINEKQTYGTELCSLLYIF